MRKQWKFEVDRQIAASPVVVWEAFSDARKFMQWFALDGQFEARMGAPFVFRHGPSDEEIERGKVIALEPQRLLAYQSGTDAEPTVMEFHLTAEGAGTRITMVHSGFCDADVDLDEYLKGSIAGSRFILGNLELFLTQNYSYQDYPFMGVQTEASPAGAVVKSVTLPWAREAGLLPGDVLTALGEHSLLGDVSLWSVSRLHTAGRPVTVHLMRNGQPLAVTVTPGGWRETAQALQAS